MINYSNQYAMDLLIHSILISKVDLHNLLYCIGNCCWLNYDAIAPGSIGQDCYKIPTKVKFCY